MCQFLGHFGLGFVSQKDDAILQAVLGNLGFQRLAIRSVADKTQGEVRVGRGQSRYGVDQDRHTFDASQTPHKERPQAGSNRLGRVPGRVHAAMHDVQLVPVLRVRKTHELRPTEMADARHKGCSSSLFVDPPMVRLEKDVGPVDRKAPPQP